MILVFPLFFWAPKEQASSNPPGEVYELQEEIDVAYLDLSTDEKLNSIIKNCKIILKQNGFLVLVLNDKYSISDDFRVQIQNTIINLKESFELIQMILLD